MLVIECENVCEGLPAGVGLLLQLGKMEKSRAGDVLVAPEPVATVYRNPSQRVLFSDIRDANPFFHLMEALWMLAGRNDGAFLDRYVPSFSSRFAEPGGYLHGAYGFRWRNWFGDDPNPIDQLAEIARELRDNPSSRRCVLQMWDAPADLGEDHKDIPCNTQVYFRRHPDDRLDMTVTCRSNDIIWGCYGANAVHFAVLQEYMAAQIGATVGSYTQISNNFHAYESVLSSLLAKCAERARRPHGCMWPYLNDNRYTTQMGGGLQPLVSNPLTFDVEVCKLLEMTEEELVSATLGNGFLQNTARPAMLAHIEYKKGNSQMSRDWCGAIAAADWRVACTEWLDRRWAKRATA